MGKLDTLLAKLQKSASDRDATTATYLCPWNRQPAIFVGVIRGDTGEGVKNIKVEISKPTQQSAATNGDGEMKADPAKLGAHTVTLLLTDDQVKEFARPRVEPATTSGEGTSVVMFVLWPLPKLVVEVKERDGGKPVDGVLINVGRLPEKKTAAGKADFGSVPPGVYRIVITLDRPKNYDVEVMHEKASVQKFEGGGRVQFDVDLSSGDVKTFQALIRRVRWVEFQLVDEETGRPIPKARLFAKLPGGAKTEVTTDDNGFARITALQDGTFEIEKVETIYPSALIKMEPGKSSA